MSKIDLHIHTNVSDDGEFTPKEVVTQCKKLGMKLIAITDHNSVRGIPEAIKESGDMKILSGVELDCTYENKNFHLLGYHFDYTCKEFLDIEEDILKQEKAAAKEKIKLFMKATGIPVDEEEVLAESCGGVVTGELIAEIVLRKKEAKNYEILHPYLTGGAKSDMPNVRFYWDFFSEGKPAYVPIHYQSLQNAVDLIHKTGGIAVLAHPGQNLGNDKTLLSGIIAEKIDGIEVFSSYHSKMDMAYYLEEAEKNHLLITCGSDYHGKHKPKIKLGGHGAVWDDDKLLDGIEIKI